MRLSVHLLSVPVRVAVASVVLCLLMVLVATADGGPSLPLLVAAGGVALLAIGVLLGSGLVVVGGVATAALASALATEPAGGASTAPLVIGVCAVAALVTADASWWLRREPRVESRVFGSVGRRLVAAWSLGAVMAVAAGTVAGLRSWSIWLVPAALVLAAASIVALGYVSGRDRGTRGRPGARRFHSSPNGEPVG